MQGFRRFPFAHKCPKLKVIVSGNIVYKLQKDTASPTGESWLKVDFECNSSKDCGVAHTDCPVFKEAPQVI
jgi:hypothetical protein